MPILHENLVLYPAPPRLFRPDPLAALCATSPLDRLVTRAWDELERAGWDVPGIDVTFAVNGTGHDLLRYVSRLSGTVGGTPFEILAEQPEGQPGTVLAAKEVAIPGYRIVTGAGHPRLFVHTGQVLADDPDRLLVGISRSSSPFRCRHNLYFQTADRDFLSHVEGTGSEIPERTQFSRDEAYDLFIPFLKNVFIPYLKSWPERNVGLNEIFAAQEVPAADVPTLYAWVHRMTWNRVRNFQAGQEERSRFRYALSGNGYRVLPLHVRNDGSALPIAHEGFSWMLPDPDLAWTQRSKANFENEEGFLLSVRLKTSNDVYVVDNSILADCKGDPNAQTSRAFARTLVPLSEYAGTHGDPVYVTTRQIGIDEVTPIPLDLYCRRAGETAFTPIQIDGEAGGAELHREGQNRCQSEYEAYELRLRLTGHERLALLRG